MEHKSTVGELVTLLEKLPKNAEVSVLVKDETSFSTEYTTIEPLSLTPLDGNNPELYSSTSIECLSTEHVSIVDTRNNKGMAPFARRVTVLIGGVITK